VNGEEKVFTINFFEILNVVHRSYFFRRDGYLIAAVFLSMLSLSISSGNTVSLALGITGVVFLQVVCCCKPNKQNFAFSAFVSLVIGIGYIFVGLALHPAFYRDDAGNATTLSPLNDESDNIFDLDNDDTHRDTDHNTPNIFVENSCGKIPSLLFQCQTTKEGSIASFISAILWFVITECIHRFVYSGRLEWWERHNSRHRNEVYSIHGIVTAIGSSDLDESDIFDDDDTASTEDLSYCEEKMEIVDVEGGVDKSNR